MPALPNAPKTLRVSTSASDSLGRQLVSRFFVTYTGTAPTPTQLNTFSSSVAAAWATDLKSLVQLTITLDEVATVDLTSNTAAEGAASVSTAGTRSGAIVPYDTCFVISYEIARRYRGGHPRGYWYFGCEADLQSAGGWSTTFQTSVTTGWAAFIAAVVAAGWSGAGTLAHANVSYYDGFRVVTSPTTDRARNVPTVRGAPVIDAVTGYLYRLPIGTQRRRVRP